MDAAAADADIKLYKASAELLAELQGKLPLLLTLDETPRKWVLSNKTSEVAHLLDRFQEWPQLLDPMIAPLIHALADAFVFYCVQSQDVYLTGNSLDFNKIEPLPRAICRLLYAFCKVRGYKVVMRLLNNEPKYIEPLLKCFRRWSSEHETDASDMSWEQRYIMLLWLSHLMLAPFELATISGFSSSKANTPELFQRLELPDVAQVLLDVAFRQLCVPGKDREAASLLIVRLVLRKDMRKLNLPEAMVTWCIEQLYTEENTVDADPYRHVGLLTLLYGLTNSSSSVEDAPFIARTFNTCKVLATESLPNALAARQSAPSRKLLIKIMRASMLHAITLSMTGHGDHTHQIEDMLEDGIQNILERLGDTDTPVRQAASKALGMIVLKLDRELAIEVIEAILACFNENILLENIKTGQLIAATDIFSADKLQYKKNVNAVDPLKWHGAMLSLGHILFRRSPPPEQLFSVLEALLMGLTFEQRSNVGTSLGLGVRDAACFGIWSLARKYSTREIEAVSFQPTTSYSDENIGEQSTLQLIATELVLASCLDPSGNLRRGASAALQELIGRHPDTICEGISVVQRVDYSSVARRSTAISDVAEAVASLDQVYHTSLLFALLGWRGCRAVDPESRRLAASTVGKLFVQASTDVQVAFSKEVVSQISDLKAGNVGVNAATRHGLLLALSALFEVLQQFSKARASPERTGKIRSILSGVFRNFDDTTGSLTGRATTDLTNVLAATASVIASFAQLEHAQRSSLDWAAQSSRIMAALDRCTTATEDELVADSAAEANLAMFILLPADAQVEMLTSWLPRTTPKQKSVYTCKGRLASISRLFPVLIQTPETAAFLLPYANFLASIVSSGMAIEIRINAMDAINTVLKSQCTLELDCLSIIARAVSAGLADYTVDQRGDVGSLLRLSSIEAVQNFDRSVLDDKTSHALMKAIIRLSAEKLSKVRFAAWNCLQSIWKEHLPGTMSMHVLQYQSDVSSFEYYRTLIQLLQASWVHDELLQGLVGSIAGGSDDVSQTSSSALISFLNEMPEEDRIEQIGRMIDALVRQLRTIIKQEDREVVPVLDTLILIIEQFTDEASSHLTNIRPTVSSLANDLQTPIADIPRIQSLIRLLSQLAVIEEYRAEAGDRISRKLLHKWPKVRHAAADAVLLLDPRAVQVSVDWNAAPLANKAEVLELRKKLGVAGKAAIKV